MKHNRPRSDQYCTPHSGINQALTKTILERSHFSGMDEDRWVLKEWEDADPLRNFHSLDRWSNEFLNTGILNNCCTIGYNCHCRRSWIPLSFLQKIPQRSDFIAKLDGKASLAVAYMPGPLSCLHIHAFALVWRPIVRTKRGAEVIQPWMKRGVWMGWKHLWVIYPLRRTWGKQARGLGTVFLGAWIHRMASSPGTPHVLVLVCLIAWGSSSNPLIQLIFVCFLPFSIVHKESDAH